MAIIRSDKRPEALELFREVRTQLDGLLTQADALQATIEAIELELGVSNETEQASRNQLLVLHYPKGDEVGHPLDECSDECAAGESLEVIGEEPGKDGEG